MQRPAVGDALRGCDDVRQAGPAAFQSRRENAIVEEARRTIGRLIEPHEQRGVSRQVDLLQVDVRRSDEVGEQGFGHRDDTFIPEETAAQKKAAVHFGTAAKLSNCLFELTASSYSFTVRPAKM